jgi:hypothetical protein
MTANPTPQVTGAAPEQQGSSIVLVEGMRVMDTRNGKLGDLKVFSSTGGFAYIRDEWGFEWQAPIRLVIPVMP